MPYKLDGRTFYKTRVSLPDGREIVAGCNTDDYETALAMETMVREFKKKRDVLGMQALELVVERTAKLPDVFDAFQSGTLPDFLNRRSAPDLAKLLAEWNGNPKYKAQVSVLLGKSFLASDFTRSRISVFLAGLKVSPSTKNRYRAALSVFAGWLVERDIIPHNPVRDVGGFKPRARELVWLDREQAKALIDGLDMPHRALEALMAATGVEWQVIERLVRRDVDLNAKTVHARGGKTPWRNRIVRATELWAWEIFAEYARDFAPNVLLFAGVLPFTALRKHRAASALLNLPYTTLHDWRHVYAVQALRDGYKASTVAHQLGHRDAYLVLTRYGRFIPDERDYALPHAATPSFHAAGREERSSS